MNPRGVSALGWRLAETIRRDGPISVADFMTAALTDPTDGYYTTRDPLGAGGDFVTSPEISQVFGEIVGVWCAELWRRMGEPAHFVLAELGPGRGTLMTDLLRALAVLPACAAAAELHLVELSPTLRAAQAAALARRHPGRIVVWHDRAETLPPGPLLLIANEFLDALPIRQWHHTGGRWTERCIGLDAAGAFAFVAGPTAAPPPGAPPAPADGAIFETNEVASTLAEALGGRLTATGGAALLIDYGHAKSGFGDTLQAVKGHGYAPVLADPGTADLTAHVDFAAVARAAGQAGARSHGPVTQHRFLIANGIEQRLARLEAGCDIATGARLRQGVRRLIDPQEMGRLFKVMALTDASLTDLPGF
ncbi:MAG TPA: SAM-dependent methyltransferase [Stellaceae bacterium]|nr:SAM-dependent methyltransferase [Stellaceae bacterium]